jgi:hypothetical protein
MAVNGVGGFLTFIVMWVFAITKFRDGAWVVVLLIPLLVLLTSSIHGHYKRVAGQLSLGDLQPKPHASPIETILLVDDVHAGTLRLVNFAQSLGQPWQAVHVAVDPDRSDRLQEKWRSVIGIGELTILPSPYRSISGPIREHIHAIQQNDPTKFVHLLAGQLAMPHHWEQVMHRNTNLLIDLVLRDMDRVVITSVPYQIDHRDYLERRLQAEL